MEASAAEVQRAMRLLQAQRKASKSYYERHKEEIKLKSLTYWQLNRQVINDKRRQRYAAAKEAQAPEQELI